MEVDVVRREGNCHQNDLDDQHVDCELHCHTKHHVDLFDVNQSHQVDVQMALIYRHAFLAWERVWNRSLASETLGESLEQVFPRPDL